MFMEQDFGIDVDENAVRNSGAYVGSWKSAIKSDPNALFTAIADADKIAKYVLQKAVGERRVQDQRSRFARAVFLGALESHERAHPPYPIG